jgi:isopentenyldiphosphate isomerase
MESLYQVVDENDNPIGLKPRNEIDFQNDYYRVSAVWVVNSLGQVLIAQRKLTKDKDPGKWGPAVAGTLEEGESYESNTYKEAEEEINLTGVEFETGPKMTFEEPRHCHLQWYIARTDRAESEFTPQPSEVERVMWIDEASLIHDVADKPDKYVPSMPRTVETLCKSS